MSQNESQSRINACRIILNWANLIKNKTRNAGEAAEAANCCRRLRGRIVKLKAMGAH